MHDFQGKTLVLTGANGGIGREVAKLFYANGANIVLTDLDEAGLLAFADTLDGGVGRVAALRMDAANPEDAEKAVVAATTRFGGIDFLVPSVGLGRSAIGTLVERSSRFIMLVHLPREVGYGQTPRTKNGPPLAGYGAVTMANALKRTVTKLPTQLWQSLTWDRGKELSDHSRFTIESGVKVFFADPHSPWQRGTNENTNGLLRQYFPKGTDLSRWSEQELEAVALTLNNRPRKTLSWKTPAEALNDYLQSVA